MNYNYTITIIRGDTCQKNVSITGVETSLIDSVYFSCNDLEIDKALTYDNTIGKWIFRLEPNETSLLKKITSDFDITVKFTDDSISTLIYRGTIRVLPKNNKVGELSNE